MRISSTAAIIVFAISICPHSALAQRGGPGGGPRGGGGSFGGRGGGFGPGGNMGGMRGPQGGGGFQHRPEVGRGGFSPGRSSGPVARPASFQQHGIPARGPMYHPGPAFSNRPAYYHGNWYHGDWHAHWARPWGYYPWGWGWYGGWSVGTSWGLGIGYGAGLATVSFGPASPWSWGYFSYYNPYWIPPATGVTYINYSHPIVVSSPASTSVLPGIGSSQTSTGTVSTPVSSTSSSFPGMPAPQPSQGVVLFDNARMLFQQGEYQAALGEVDKAIAITPNDSLMHEFRALCLFALHDYQQSAAAVYALISAGPGWDGTTVSNLYSNRSIYDQQLQTLEIYSRQNPDIAAAHFLLAYHYLLNDRNQDAAQELETVVRLQPNDQLSAQLLKGLSPASEPTSTPASPPTSSVPFDATTLQGTWKATRADGSSFSLTLTPDGRFDWLFQQQDKQQAFSGKYTLANDFLILSASDENTLIGKINMETPQAFTFKLAGGNPAEPGLRFTR